MSASPRKQTKSGSSRHVRLVPEGRISCATKSVLIRSSRRRGSSATAACGCRAQRAPASGLFPGVSPEPVEDVGEVVAGPAFGDLVADDMIDMNSFGVNLEPCRRDVVIGSKVR